MRKQLAKVVENKEKFENHDMKFNREKELTFSMLAQVRLEISAAVDEDISGIRDKQREKG